MNFLLEIKNFVSKCMRVWNVTRKPTTPEFKTVSKAAALGILIIGLLGFLIASIVNPFIPK